MDARSELLAYLGAALVTTAALFGAQIWYATYLDTHVVNVYPADAPGNEKVAAVRAQERAKLEGGKTPIAQAKAALAQRGRTAFPNIAPKPSEDLSAMSGWMLTPGFKPYAPRTPVAAQPSEGAAVEGAPIEGAPAEAEAAGATAEKAPAEPTAAADRAPARRRPATPRVAAPAPAPAPGQ